MTEKKVKVISLSNLSESEGGYESETKPNATVSSESDADDNQVMRTRPRHQIMKRKNRMMDSDSDPSSDAEFIKQRKKKNLDTETSSQNEYESSEDDFGDKKTFMMKGYRIVIKSKLLKPVKCRKYDESTNSEMASSQSESDESYQRDKNKNTPHSESYPDDTSDDEEKSSRKEKKKDCETSSSDSRRSWSRDKDDSTSEESSDSDKENKTKSQIKNGIKVISRIPRHFRKRGRKRRLRSPTDDSERTDSAEEGTTRKVPGMKGKKMPSAQEKFFTYRKGR